QSLVTVDTFIDFENIICVVASICPYRSWTIIQTKPIHLFLDFVVNLLRHLDINIFMLHNLMFYFPLLQFNASIICYCAGTFTCVFRTVLIANNAVVLLIIPRMYDLTILGVTILYNTSNASIMLQYYLHIHIYYNFPNFLDGFSLAHLQLYDQLQNILLFCEVEAIGVNYSYIPLAGYALLRYNQLYIIVPEFYLLILPINNTNECSSLMHRLYKRVYKFLCAIFPLYIIAFMEFISPPLHSRTFPIDHEVFFVIFIYICFLFHFCFFMPVLPCQYASFL
ncbi:hypothetical protein ACJX0J_007076, partial [Zea mays]